MAVKITILGSGSNGNSLYVESPETRLLIDAGFSARQLRLRLGAIGSSADLLQAILLTHEHSDHVKGLAVLCSKLDLPIYCNRLTADAIEYQFGRRFNFQLFQTGAEFQIGDLTIETFPVPHDAQDPVGFLVKSVHGVLGVLTDLGHATQAVLQRVRQANVLLLEANHDTQLLQADVKRPWSVKQRILSRHGHLSNEAAASVAEQLVHPKLQRLYLGHLSSDCNSPELAQQTVADRLRTMGASHVEVLSTAQDIPSETFLLQQVARSESNAQMDLFC